MAEATEHDLESVVGEECHIVSAKRSGPRHVPSVHLTEFDAYDNLILLCRDHHKVVDDQRETYTAECLREMKKGHERWVSDRLSDSQGFGAAKVLSVPGNTPAFLAQLRTGQEVLRITMDACAYSREHDELLSQEEVDLVGGFLEVVEDFGDIASELGAGERAQIEFDLTQSLRKLEQAGFWVFGFREMKCLRGNGKEAEWPVAILRVVREGNDEITTPSEQGM